MKKKSSAIIKFFSRLRALLLFAGLLITGAFVTPLPDGRIDKIERALKNAEAFLLQIQQTDGSIRDTANPLFETWETILAAKALYGLNSKYGREGCARAIRFLKSNENAEGLICHNSKCKKAYCLETTSTYFSLLIQLGKNTLVKERIKRILHMQKPSGQWAIGNPDVNEETEFPSVTAFVLNVLDQSGHNPIYAEQSMDWLLNKQNKEGHWGATWEYYDCPAYALWPILETLAAKKDERSRSAMASAVRYIISSQTNEGSWNYKAVNSVRSCSPELQTALMLSALRHSGETNEKVISKGVDYLLAHQDKTGCWDGGEFPIRKQRYSKKEYVFATALAIEVLNEYLKKLRKPA